MRNIAIFSVWPVIQYQSSAFINATHKKYLEYLASRNFHVDLLVPTLSVNELKKQLEPLPKGINLIPLPWYKNYYQAYKKSSLILTKITVRLLQVDYELFYARFPDPFCWYPFFIFSLLRKKRVKLIAHLVGNPLEIYRQTSFKKYIIFKTFEWPLLLKAMRKADYVYANGPHLSNELEKFGVKSIPVISSTLSSSEFYKRDFSCKSKHQKIKIIILSHLREEKRIDLLLNAFEKLLKVDRHFQLSIIGDGPIKTDLQNYVRHKGLSSFISFLGHIDDREKLLFLLRNSDMFWFNSISEGSPRVILEAMANSLVVISNRVGSLPYVFSHEKDILFAENPEDYVRFALRFKQYPYFFFRIARSAFKKTFSNYKIDNFLGKIFDVET